MARTRMADRLDEGEPVAAPPSTKRPGRHALVAEPVESAAAGTPLEIPVELIDPAEDNPRAAIDMDSDSMRELVASVKELGVQSPVQVLARDGRYALVYGHRRLAASIGAGRTTIPGFVATVQDDAGRQVRMIVENTHREDLTPMEEARAYDRLLRLGAAKGQRALAKLVHKSQGHVSKRLALLGLAEDVQAKVEAGGIPISAAEELAKLADEPERVARVVQGMADYGGIESALARERQRKEREDADAVVSAQLRAEGLTVLETSGPPNSAHGPWPVSKLAWVDADEHAGLGCHAMRVERGGKVVAVCMDPQAHPDPHKADEDQRQAQREAEELATIEARSAARKARWDLVCGLVRKGSPEAGAALAMQMWLCGGWVQIDAEAVAEALGLSVDTFRARTAADAVREFSTKGTRNAQRAVYATAVAMGEATLDDALRSGAVDEGDADRVLAYLDLLVRSGHEPTVEEQGLLAEAQTVVAEMAADAAGEDGAES